MLNSVPRGAEPFVLLEQSNLNPNHDIIYVCDTNQNAFNIYRALLAFNLHTIDVMYFPGWDSLFYDRVSPSLAVMMGRIQVLTQLSMFTRQKPRIVVTTLKGFTQKTIASSILKQSITVLYPKNTVEFNTLIDGLQQKGYQRVDMVQDVGDYCIRGGIIDLFSPFHHSPIRIDMFGDEIESIKHMDLITQKSNDSVDSCVICPVNEIFLNKETILNFRTHYRSFVHNSGQDPLYKTISEGRFYPGMEQWLPYFYNNQTECLDDYLITPKIFMDEKVNSNDFYGPLHAAHELRPTLLPPPALFKTQIEIDDFKPIIVSPFQSENNNWGGSTIIPPLGLECLQRTLAQNKCVTITCASDSSLERVSQFIKDHGINDPIHIIQSHHDINPNQKSIYLWVFPTDNSFVHPTLGIFECEKDLTGRIGSSRSKSNHPKFFKDDSPLNPGDYVVHMDHGVGRYQGLVSLTVGSISHECVLLFYSNDDKLFVPVENLDCVSKYCSADGHAELDKLGGHGWQSKKERAQKKIFEIAHSLINTAAERALKKGIVFNSLSEEYQQFCAGFGYVETDDQEQAIVDILNNLQSGMLMDRLICGDVGFGKTEVAMRAAFCAIASGYQVAVLTPTTLLARQHTIQFQNRFQKMPYQIGHLSRLTKTSQKKILLENLHVGTVDIVIGTHSLLSDHVQFHNLGLIIVDEEQHFGVKQKEKLKALKNDVHVLTLSATPIPRTLQMALTGIRDLSLIQTPPINRLPIKTAITPVEKDVIIQAVNREYNRGGQIFYVCPRIEHLEELQKKLAAWFPNLKIAVAHGRLTTTELEDVISDFYDHHYDILLSTHIIESGIDIPNANTMIIHRSDLFGLSQLYQLRGRIGRSKLQAYCYLTYEGMLQKEAERRLTLLQTLDYLGAGFTLASHDLDMRGSGNLVGSEQAGHIKEIGSELYHHLLNEAIAQIKLGNNSFEPLQSSWTPQINTGVSSLI